MKPRYVHDCENCHFVGQHDTLGGDADLYYCPG